MSQGRRNLILLGGALGLFLFVGAACEKKPPEAANAALSADEEAAHENHAESGGASQVSRPLPDAAAHQRGAAPNDAPGTPACLVAADPAGGWARRSAARVFEPAKLAGVVSPQEAARLRPFRIKQAAACTYGVATPGGERAVEALVIEAQDAVDAYGIFTCAAPEGGELLNVGGETRVDRSRGYTAHCWQGRAYMRLHLAATDAGATEQIARLLANMAGRVPREDRPEIVEAMPREGAVLSGLWVVRDVSSVPADALGVASGSELAKMGELLDLGEHAVLCIGQYAVPQGRQPNVVWVARYASAKAAYEAHSRYRRHLATARDPFSLSTNLLPAHGPYVVGTWTAEEESLQYVLPRINQLLPS